MVGHSDDARNLSTASRPGALTKGLRKPLKDLMDKYDKPGDLDKTAQVQGKVDHVKGIMQVIKIMLKLYYHHYMCASLAFIFFSFV